MILVQHCSASQGTVFLRRCNGGDYFNLSCVCVFTFAVQNIGAHDQAEIMLQHLDKLNEAVIAQTGHQKKHKNQLPKRKEAACDDENSIEDGDHSDQEA